MWQSQVGTCTVSTLHYGVQKLYNETVRTELNPRELYRTLLDRTVLDRTVLDRTVVDRTVLKKIRTEQNNTG